MKELRQALLEIHSIRHQVARSTQFRGYGPVSSAFSGLLALVVAGSQAELAGHGTYDSMHCLVVWVATAAVALFLSAIETFARSRRVHSGLAQEMIQSAVEQFLPALIAGVLLTAVMLRVAPENFWLLPGLWEVIFSLGIFASCRFLPRQMFAVGVWYLAAGLCSMVVAGATKTFSPWIMGVPFGVGQLLVAAVLRFGFEENLDQT